MKVLGRNMFTAKASQLSMVFVKFFKDQLSVKNGSLNNWDLFSHMTQINLHYQFANTISLPIAFTVLKPFVPHVELL